MPNYLFIEAPPDFIRKNKAGRPPKWVPQAAAMRKNPGMWLMLENYQHLHTARALVPRINKGTAPAFREGRWEAVSRGTKVYARYIGD